MIKQAKHLEIMRENRQELHYYIVMKHVTPKQ